MSLLELVKSNDILDIVNDNYIISKTDKNGVINFVNDNFCEISGYSKDELIGKPHNIVRHPDMPSSVFRTMWQKIKSGQTFKCVIKNRKKNGDFYVLDVVVAPITVNNKQEFISIRTDITRFYKQQKREKYKSVDDAKANFLHIFTHELKTPLNGMITFSEVLNKKLKKIQIENIKQQDIDKFIKLSNDIYLLTNMQHRIVESMLDSAKLNNNKYYINISNISIKQVLENKIELLSQIYKTEIEYDIDDIIIKSDLNSIEHIVINLISNGCKYGDGKMFVSFKKYNDKAILSIEDNGNGIKEEDREKIFNMFEQLEDKCINRIAQGTGIGLYFVKQLCNLLGYEIKVGQSQKLGGARFDIIINLK